MPEWTLCADQKVYAALHARRQTGHRTRDRVSTATVGPGS